MSSRVQVYHISLHVCPYEISKEISYLVIKQVETIPAWAANKVYFTQKREIPGQGTIKVCKTSFSQTSKFQPDIE